MPTSGFPYNGQLGDPVKGNAAGTLRIDLTQGRTMNLLDEALIERYVRFQSVLTEQEMEEAKRLLQTSSAARNLADFFRDFYEDLDALGEPPEPPPQGDPQSGSDDSLAAE